MAVAKGSKSQTEPKTKQSSTSKTPMTQGPARLYGDGEPDQVAPPAHAPKPPAPPKGNATRAPRTPKPAPKASGGVGAKPGAAAKGNKTPAARTTKPKA